MEVWNYLNLSKPPETSRIFLRRELEKSAKETSLLFVKNEKNSNISTPEQWILNLRSSLQSATSMISPTDKHIKLETSAISAFVYHNKRHKKDFFMKAIMIVLKCLKRWENIKIGDLVSATAEMIPSQFVNIEKIRLPIPESICFLVYRIYGSYHLIKKTLGYCLQAGVYLQKKILSSHFFWLSTVGLSFISRIWCYCIDLLKSLSTSYDELHPYLCGFLLTHPVDNMVLPSPNLVADYKDFIKKNKKSKSKFKPSINKENKTSMAFFNMDDDEEADDVASSSLFLDDELKLNNNIKAKTKIIRIEKVEKPVIPPVVKDNPFIIDTAPETEDIGDIVSDSMYKKMKSIDIIKTENKKKMKSKGKKKFERYFDS